jgi:hypothetical protein
MMVAGRNARARRLRAVRAKRYAGSSNGVFAGGCENQDGRAQRQARANTMETSGSGRARGG